MDQTKKQEVHFAPLQGYTDHDYRNAFEQHFGDIDTYYTPFLRVERGSTFRHRDVRDVEPGNNRVPNLIPQILGSSPEEMELLVRLLAGYDYKQVDINLGCPFPMIAGKCKGAGILPYPDKVDELLKITERFPEIRFSVKMRLGWEQPDECLRLLPVLNRYPLQHVTVHARIGTQQYKGETDPDAFGLFYNECKHPLFYNGDLNTPEDMENILTRFQRLRGVVIGRGLLSSPFLVKDFFKKETLDTPARMQRLAAFHETLFEAYAARLQGDHQLLTKMKTLWDYLLPDTDKRILKKIKKSNKVTQYREALRDAFRVPEEE